MFASEPVGCQRGQPTGLAHANRYDEPQRTERTDIA